jgi:hypothetical protein
MKRIGRILLRAWWACLSQPNQMTLALVLAGVAWLGQAQGWWPAWVLVNSAFLTVAWLGFSFLAGKQREQIMTRSVAEIEARLVGRTIPRGDFSVGWVFWYGAVDISPVHCVVWLILRGDAAQVPEYAQLDRLPLVTDEILRAWMAGLRAEASAIFRANGWRRWWPPPSIGFESESRASFEHFH